MYIHPTKCIYIFVFVRFQAFKPSNSRDSDSDQYSLSSSVEQVYLQRRHRHRYLQPASPRHNHLSPFILRPQPFGHQWGVCLPTLFTSRSQKPRKCEYEYEPDHPSRKHKYHISLYLYWFIVRLVVEKQGLYSGG